MASWPRVTSAWDTRGKKGRDPISVAEAGTRFGVPGQFRVQMRYDSIEQATAARNALPIVTENGAHFVNIDVPVRHRETMAEDMPHEVSVQW